MVVRRLVSFLLLPLTYYMILKSILPNLEVRSKYSKLYLIIKKKNRYLGSRWQKR